MANEAPIRKRKKNPKKRLRRILIALFTMVILVASLFFFLFNHFLGKVNTEEITNNEEELYVNKDLAKIDYKLTNLALFGIDTRDDDYSESLADTIMIATIDPENKKIKITSVMRDTYARIPDHGYNKINSSYALGGPELSIKTLNLNFDMNITDYVVVDFEAVEKIVDAVGGVEIELKDYEVKGFNDSLNALNGYLGGTYSDRISSPGTYNMDGRQAVAYSRIRKVGNGDYERTERQRSVLEQLFNKIITEKSLKTTIAFADSILPYVKTSLTRGEIISLGTQVFTSGTRTLEGTRLPTDDYIRSAMISEISYLLPDTLVDNARHLHQFIYENEEYEPSDALQEISNRIDRN
ncbi:MAG: LCP family protein [Eubacteriaceae bacterium]|nr:LCP family protein [Eubacteriaceae bacterium]